MNNSILELQKIVVKDLEKSAIRSANIDARILLEKVCDKSREFLLANPKFELSNNKIKKLNSLVERRKNYEPIAYITGQKEFFGLSFEVTKDVLIPRPETEQIIEIALDLLKSKSNKLTTVLDVGTGSGNIIISIAKANSFKPITNIYFASDISSVALNIARRNARKHKVKIKFIKSDLFKDISRRFDLIIANLPYVPEGGSNNKEIKYEPQGAIFAKNNGTKIIKKFLNQAKNYLNKKGIILIEVDPRNVNEITKYSEKLFKSAEIILDLSSKKRLIKISN